MKIRMSKDYEDRSEESQVEPSPRIENKEKATIALSTKRRQRIPGSLCCDECKVARQNSRRESMHQQRWQEAFVP